MASRRWLLPVDPKWTIETATHHAYEERSRPLVKGRSLIKPQLGLLSQGAQLAARRDRFAGQRGADALKRCIHPACVALRQGVLDHEICRLHTWLKCKTQQPARRLGIRDSRIQFVV